MKKVGVFSGSFNPVHIGHLALANWLCEYENLSEVWFLVTPQNPLKKGLRMLDFQYRYAMTQAAVSDYSRFKVSDFENHLPQPSYTIDTLRSLKQAYLECFFYLIIGADNWEILEQWKDAASLVEEFPVLIYPRSGYNRPVPPHQTTVRRVDAPLLEISSSFIRKAIKEGRDIRFFLPEPVRDQITHIKNIL
jgi:nicotinate-nucleotide adenylyltransferase